MKFSDKYKANAYMIAGLSCFYPFGAAMTVESKAINLMDWLLYATIALNGLLIVYGAYKECQSKEKKDASNVYNV